MYFFCKMGGSTANYLIASPSVQNQGCHFGTSSWGANSTQGLRLEAEKGDMDDVLLKETGLGSGKMEGHRYHFGAEKHR